MVITPEPAAGVEAWWITSPQEETDRVLLYFHGGGWVFGWMGFYDSFVARLAQAAKARAIGVDYRLAPEHPYPAALEDCLGAYRFLMDRGTPPGKIVLIGDSAGGNLTLATLLALKGAGLPLPAAGVCLCAVTDLAAERSASAPNVKKDVVLDPPSMGFFHDSYLAGRDPHDPLISPIYGDLAGLPPLLIQAGGDEILLEDSQRLAAKAAQAGVDATLHVYPGMWHVWQVFAPYLPEARQAVEEIGLFIQSRT
jgi:acetyl esterase/lipase